MSIKIDWGTGNADADSVVIYRSLTPINLAALPAPLVTLAGSETSYVDATAARNTVYNYIIAVTKGNDTVLSQNKAYGYYPDTGPGPTTLIRGDWTEGYFGSMSSTEFITAQELITATGVNAQGANLVTNIWHKFALDGKILFIPQYAMASNTSMVIVYNAGCAYGSDDNGNHPWKPGAIPGAYATIQNKKITKSGFTFAVRLPKGATTPTNEFAPAPTTVVEAHMNSEWYRTMGRIFLNQSTLITRPRCDDYLFSNLNGQTGHANTLSQNYYNSSGYLIMPGYTALDNMPAGMGGSNSGYYWRPVLELVL